MRLQKDFRLGEKVRSRVFADAFNLLNERRDRGMHQLAGGRPSSFWFPSEPVDPRRLMLGAKLRF